MNIQDKYNALRSSIQNGDIILTRGKSILALLIQWSDKAYFNHALVVFRVGDRLLCIQAMAQGVVPYFLSQEILDNADFCLIKPLFPQAHLDECVDAFFTKTQNGEKYNKFALLKILLAEKLGIKSKEDFSQRDICSTAALWNYGSTLPLTCYFPEKIGRNYITPMDAIRFADPAQVDIVGDDSDLVTP